MGGEDLEPDGHAVDEPGGDTHGRAAVEVRGCGEGGGVHDGSCEADLLDQVRAGDRRRRRAFGDKGDVGAGRAMTKSAASNRSAIDSFSCRR